MGESASSSAVLLVFLLSVLGNNALHAQKVSAEERKGKSNPESKERKPFSNIF